MAAQSHAPVLADKIALRRLGRERRQAFVASLEPEERGRLEHQLADVLDPLLAKSRVAGGYAPLPTEISPLPALERASARGTLLAFPAFPDHQSPFRLVELAPEVSAEDVRGKTTAHYVG